MHSEGSHEERQEGWPNRNLCAWAEGDECGQFVNGPQLLHVRVRVNDEQGRGVINKPSQMSNSLLLPLLIDLIDANLV